jgi:hypothetical protein
MKRLFLSITIVCCLSVAEGQRQNILLDPATLLTLVDAERILGEQAAMTDSSSTTKDGLLKYGCTYTGKVKDQKSGKLGAIYFLYAHYPEISAAQKKYVSIKKANENSEGVKVLEHFGDEAYFHSDGENFYFIMARKGDKVFIIKLNKITSKTSLDEFNNIAKKVCDSL